MTVGGTYPNGLRPKQVEGAMTMFMKRRHLLADHPGSGKSAQLMVALELDGAFRRRKGRPYVTLIATAMTACQLTWAPELRDRVASQYDIVLCDLTDPGTRKTLPTLAARDDKLAASWIDAQETGRPLVILTNFESMRIEYRKGPLLPTLFEIPIDAIALDEAHLVLPTKEDAPAKVTQFWLGLMWLKLEPHAMRFDLTGTPDRGTLTNRYGHWKFLFPEWFTNYWTWVRASFEIETTRVQGRRDPRTGQHRIIEIPEAKGLKNPAQWVAFEQEHMTRRTKAEMLQGLPAKQWAGEGGIDLPLTPAQRTQYKDFEAETRQKELALIADDEPGLAQALKLQFALRSRQMATCTWDWHTVLDDEGKEHMTGTPRRAGPAESSKLAWILEWLDERAYLPNGFDATGGKVVIVSFFSEVLHWLQDELARAGVQAEILEGGVGQAEKIRRQEAFQNGALRVILLQGSLGVSINLDAADDMIFVDYSSDPDQIEQAEDRIHRASRNHQTTYWRLAAIGTTDQVILDRIDHKYSVTRNIYDGERGVEYARHMIADTSQKRSIT